MSEEQEWAEAAKEFEAVVPPYETLVEMAKQNPPPQEWYDEEPVEFSWTESGFKARQAYKQFTEGLSSD